MLAMPKYRVQSRKTPKDIWNDEGWSYDKKLAERHLKLSRGGAKYLEWRLIKEGEEAE